MAVTLKLALSAQDGEWPVVRHHVLTEPHCGTDLGLLRSRTSRGDGSYKVTGSKIFISAGEHDLTENIIHLVLARFPMRKGVKGISLFLVPKYLPKEDGTRDNRTACNARPSNIRWASRHPCQMNFDDSVGWLVGEPNKGMARCSR
jgi:alkylation response protein AidB-like acyl-CoA dehydrogenase